jgi:hypothetical protein
VDKKTYIELYETDIDVNAQQFAAMLWEEFSAGIATQVGGNADLYSMLGGDPGISEADVQNIVVPAFVTQTFKHLAELAKTSNALWSDVFWRNLRERYETEGGIEP